MDPRDGTTDLRVAKGPHPAGLGGRIASDPRADSLDDEDVREARDHRLTAWAGRASLDSHEVQGALEPFRLR